MSQGDLFAPQDPAPPPPPVVVPPVVVLPYADVPDPKHRRFLGELDASLDAVKVVAAWMTRLGYPVRVPEIRRAPSRSRWREFSDAGDFYIRECRYEVKRLTVTFTCAQDWPFGEKFIVCSDWPQPGCCIPPLLQAWDPGGKRNQGDHEVELIRGEGVRRMDAKSGRTSSDALVAFLNTLMTTRESRSIEELRDSVRSMGMDPDRLLARTKEQMDRAREEAQLGSGQPQA